MKPRLIPWDDHSKWLSGQMAKFFISLSKVLPSPFPACSVCKGLCVQCHCCWYLITRGSFIATREVPALPAFTASAVLEPLWQLIGSKALLTCASLGVRWVCALFWIWVVGDNRLLALKHKCNPPFMSLGKQRLNSMYHVN